MMAEKMSKLKKVHTKDLLKQATALQVAVYEYLDDDVNSDVCLNALEEIGTIIAFNIRKFVKDNR